MISNTNVANMALAAYYQHISDSEHHFEIQDFIPLPGGADHIMYTFNLIDGKVIQPSVLRLFKWPDAAGFEYKVMETLGHNNIPVPKVFILENDANYLGSPFLIIEKIKGNSLANVIASKLAADASWFTSPESTSLCQQYAELLASIHRLDSQGLGLAFLKPSKWSIETIVASFSSPVNLELAARFEEIKKLFEWCLASVPKSVNPERVILHGDYHPNNVMVYGDEILAVIDWTDICLGETAIDVGWANLIFYMLGAEALINPFITEYKRSSGRELADLALYEVIAGLRLLVNLFTAMSVGSLNNNVRPEVVAAMDINKNLSRLFGFIYQKTGIDISNVVRYKPQTS